MILSNEFGLNNAEIVVFHTKKKDINEVDLKPKLYFTKVPIEIEQKYLLNYFNIEIKYFTKVFFRNGFLEDFKKYLKEKIGTFNGETDVSKYFTDYFKIKFDEYIAENISMIKKDLNYINRPDKLNALIKFRKSFGVYE